MISGGICVLPRRGGCIRFAILLVGLVAMTVSGTGVTGSTAAQKTGDARPCDVVIYGGTSAGVAAAAQAARMGRSVVLIAPGQHLGGMSSSGLGRTDIGNRKSVGGLALEFYERVGDHYGKPLQLTFEPHVAEQVFDDMVEEAGVAVVRGQRLDRSEGVQKHNGRIMAITMESGLTFEGPVFIDATYVGDLMAAAGVSYTIGRESSDTYGESLAGTLKSEKYVTEDIDPYVKR
ncbi:MAG: FAD-dependent oxidoreductase, partial [Planctomycetota bacterium]